MTNLDKEPIKRGKVNPVKETKLDNLDVKPYKWGDLDKELEELISQASSYDWQNTDYDKIQVQIKTVILEALKADMRKEIRGFDPLAYKSYKSGYNQAIDDCLEVCNKLLGEVT